jgi:hypothetical protein
MDICALLLEENRCHSGIHTAGQAQDDFLAVDICWRRGHGRTF